MRHQQWGLYAIALVVLVVGLVALGVPASTLLVAGLFLACPLMMLVMMRGMHGGHGGYDAFGHSIERPDTHPDDRDHEATSGRR
jgi:hypothetical protein